MASLRVAAPCGVASRSGGVSPKVREGVKREGEEKGERQEEKQGVSSPPTAERDENTYNFFLFDAIHVPFWAPCALLSNPPTPRRGAISTLRIICEAHKGISMLRKGSEARRFFRLVDYFLGFSRRSSERLDDDRVSFSFFEKNISKTGRLRRPAQGRSFGTIEGFDTWTVSTVSGGGDKGRARE